MKRYLISIVVIVAVSAMAWVAFSEEAAKPPSSGRGRGFLSPEEQQKVIEAIEQQVAKLKASTQIQALPAGKSYQDLSEDERAKVKEQFTKVREERQAATRAILIQLARLQGQSQPAEGEQFIIVNTADLKAVQALAEKEKAKDTAARIAEMLQPRRRSGGGPPAGQPGQPGEGGARQRQGAPKPPAEEPKKP